MRNYIISVYTSRVKFGEKGSVPIDQTPAMDFNIDPHTGRVMTDIQRLVHIQNDLQLASEFAQLKEFKPKFLPPDMTDEDAIKFACPRLSQLPSELLQYRLKLAESKLNEVKMKKRTEFQKAYLAKQQELFDKFISKESKSD